MIKYICNTCKDTKELMKATIKVENGKVITKEAYCKKCKEYMQEYDKSFKGFPNLIRTEPTLSKKGDKLWDRAKEKLCGERGMNESFD